MQHCTAQSYYGGVFALRHLFLPDVTKGVRILIYCRWRYDLQIYFKLELEL